MPQTMCEVRGQLVGAALSFHTPGDQSASHHGGAKVLGLLNYGSLPFRTSSLSLNLDLDILARRAVTPLGYARLRHSSTPAPEQGLQGRARFPVLRGCFGSNSCLHASAAGTLPMEPCPWTSLLTNSEYHLLRNKTLIQIPIKGEAYLPPDPSVLCFAGMLSGPTHPHKPAPSMTAVSRKPF